MRKLSRGLLFMEMSGSIEFMLVRLLGRTMKKKIRQ